MPMLRPVILMGCLIAAGLSDMLSARAIGQDVEWFRQAVVPVLQQRCVGCHNNSARKGGLSLQDGGDLAAGGYVEPGDVEASHLLRLVTPDEGQAEMPKDGPPLTEAELAAIRQWIERGGSWPEGVTVDEPHVKDFDWWSYRPLTRPTVPAVHDEWVRTPIDAFVADSLRQRGLSHSSDTDRRTLIRRVTYDLIGLPPTPEEVQAFVQDPDERAYEKLVDRLLASKHYGERWARHWLDVVKYADTCGYDKDKLRPNAWPYRDYVVRSFNDDKPYAKFVREQIAGDVLYPDEPDGILALGFVAAGPWDFIGHVEVPESKIDGKVARDLDRDDMVSNAINTFCSLTVQCARCHNHKFDPIRQQQYYGLQAIFSAVDRADRPFDPDPVVHHRRRELELQLQQVRGDIDGLEREIAVAAGPRLQELNQRADELKSLTEIDEPATRGFHSQIESRPDELKWVEVRLDGAHALSRIVLHPCYDTFAGIGAGFGFPVRYRLEIANGDGPWKSVGPAEEVIHGNPGLAEVTVDCGGQEATRIRITALTLVERQSDYIFALAELEAMDAEGRNVARDRQVASLDSIEAPPAWARNNLTDGLWPRMKDSRAAEQLDEVKRERAELLAGVETPARIQRRQELHHQLRQLELELAQLPAPLKVYAAATHFDPQGNFVPTRGKPRPIRVLARGNVQQPLDPAPPGVLPLSDGGEWMWEDSLSEAERRKALADWLTRPDHPLVWRSVVNRVWQYHFGQGLVATPNDFGRMGAKPTHPELLDWLACEFRDGGGSFKQLHRLIVTSSVYRQAASSNEANAAVDANNQYLWRMARRRLEAEEVRDSLLAISGALDPRMGGPGYYLFALEKPEHSPHYEYQKFDPANSESHRRSIYAFVVRSQPNPWMTTLDCADSSQSTPRRNDTLTSLQALSLLNNPFVLVMAERFADRLSQETPAIEQQVDRAMWLVAQRAPDPSERDQMVDYARTYGMANLCRVLFNLSELLYVE